MNTDELFALVKLVYPECHAKIDSGAVYYASFDETAGHFRLFNPSLNGYMDSYRLQALDVIVAALSLPGTLALHKFETTKGVYFQFIRNRDPGLTWEDPLQAACAALLSQEGR